MPDSYWVETSSIASYPALRKNLTVDVAIVGAGITGLTAAYLLKRAGYRVAVIDRLRAGGVDSMFTTAHVTCVTDTPLQDLVRSFGRDHAQAVWDAGLAATDQLETIVRTEKIACDWMWVPGYKFSALEGNGKGDQRTDLDQLKTEAALADELGFDAVFLDEVPGLGRPGVAFEHQARFHPGKYLARLAALVHGQDSAVFEHTECEEVIDEPLGIKAGGHTISCGHVVLATHNPLMGKSSIASASLLQTKLFLYTSYAVGGKLPRGAAPEALFWDTATPYHYVRVDRRRDHAYVIFGGEDHKTGQVTDTDTCYENLERTALRHFPGLKVTHRWSGQVIETNDGLPFIGETSSRQFAATGYAGNGMTFGTLAGMMARDAIAGTRNPWRDLFDVGRTNVLGGAWDYIKENIDYPYYLIRDRFAGAEGKSLRAIGRGEGKILSLDGERVAASRAADGTVTRLSPVCTHMGCIVAWNSAERTWDCPCHGSRFQPDGSVLSGPVESPLERIGRKAKVNA